MLWADRRSIHSISAKPRHSCLHSWQQGHMLHYMFPYVSSVWERCIWFTLSQRRDAIKLWWMHPTSLYNLMWQTYCVVYFKMWMHIAVWPVSLYARFPLAIPKRSTLALSQCKCTRLLFLMAANGRRNSLGNAGLSSKFARNWLMHSFHFIYLFIYLFISRFQRKRNDN